VSDEITNSKCVVCNGCIVGVYTNESNPVKYGDFNLVKVRKFHGYHCRDCGIAYYKLPEIKNPELT